MKRGLIWYWLCWPRDSFGMIEVDSDIYITQIIEMVKELEEIEGSRAMFDWDYANKDDCDSVKERIAEQTVIYKTSVYQPVSP